MSKIFHTLLEIQNTAGTNAKKEILKNNMSPTLRMIFEDTYGPQKYYIKKFVPDGEYGDLSIDTDYGTFHCALFDLVTRKVTGDAAERLLQKTVALYDYESQEILYKIIDRNLKIGISLDNFLDVIGEKSTKFEVALAENLNKAKGVDPIDGTYFVSRKLDGVRCICFVNKRPDYIAVRFLSRQGKIFTTLDNLAAPVSYFMGSVPDGNWVLDGEVCMMDAAGNESFNGLMKEVTRKDHTIENPLYNVFDILTLDEFEGKVVSRPFNERVDMLWRLRDYNNSAIYVIHQELVTSQDVLDRWVDTAKANGWEGCMLRKDVPYKRGRSKDLLKIKGMQDAEYIVTGIIEGTATYNEGGAKEYPVVAALTIEHKGNTVKVGSGLSKEQRIGWLQNPNEIIGKTVTIQYFEETQDSKTKAYSLRFPVLKHVYEDGRNI